MRDKSFCTLLPACKVCTSVAAAHYVNATNGDSKRIVGHSLYLHDQETFLGNHSIVKHCLHYYFYIYVLYK